MAASFLFLLNIATMVDGPGPHLGSCLRGSWLSKVPSFLCLGWKCHCRANTLKLSLRSDLFPFLPALCPEPGSQKLAFLSAHTRRRGTGCPRTACGCVPCSTAGLPAQALLRTTVRAPCAIPCGLCLARPLRVSAPLPGAPPAVASRASSWVECLEPHSTTWGRLFPVKPSASTAPGCVPFPSVLPAPGPTFVDPAREAERNQRPVAQHGATWRAGASIVSGRDGGPRHEGVLRPCRRLPLRPMPRPPQPGQRPPLEGGLDCVGRCVRLSC